MSKRYSLKQFPKNTTSKQFHTLHILISVW